VDIGITCSVAMAIFLGAIVLQAEMKTAPTTMTMATTNEMRCSELSTPPINPRPRKGKG
jgi:hypothetical protein